MKLFNLAAIILLSCVAAFGQNTVQCFSFPCTVVIQAAQCPALPCSITITNSGQKFIIGNKVVVTHATPNIAVRLTPASAGGLLGVQPNGRTGIVVAGPVTDTTGDNKVRYQINYAVGADGWSIQDFLEKAAVQPPPPPPAKSVVLNWTAPASDGAASYNLYRATGSGALVKVGNVVGSILTFTDVTPPSGTYQYSARTVDSSGRESVDSNIVTVTIP